MSWGKAQIEINAADTYIWTANDGPNGYFMLTMERGAAASDYGYEVFDVLNNTTFNNYCSAAKLKVAVNTVGQGSGGGAPHTSIPSTSYFYMRWHGQPFAALPTLQRGNTSFTSTAYYSDRICDCQFLTMYASGINAGFWKIDGVSHTATASWEKKVDKTVKWVFDAGIAQNQLWSYDLSQKTGLEQVVASTQPRYVAATSLHPQTYSTPGDAGISTTFKGYFSGRSSSDSYRWSLSNLKWYTKGEYNNTTTTGTSREWYELQLENKKYYSKNLKNNNFSAATLASYAPFGFTGAITEGMPIGIFKKVCLVEFDLDTTSLGQDAIIAFDTAPMVITSTQRLDDWPVNSNFDLVVDGITKPTSAAKISAGLHHIKLNIKNDTEKMILFKVSFPKTVTSSVRKIFRLPTEYAVTSMD